MDKGWKDMIIDILLYLFTIGLVIFVLWISHALQH